MLSQRLVKMITLMRHFDGKLRRWLNFDLEMTITRQQRAKPVAQSHLILGDLPDKG